MSIRALDWAIQQPLKGPAKTVLLVLANRANNAHECWPSIDRIAFDSGFSKSSIKRAIKELQEAGYLTLKRRNRTGGGYSTNGYRLSLSASPEHQGSQRPVVHSDPGVGSTQSPTKGHSDLGAGSTVTPKPKEGIHIEPKYEPKVSFGRRYSHVEDI